MEKKIEHLIKSKGFKLIEVAILLNISKQLLNYRCKTFNKGVLSFDKDEIKKIASFLKCDVKEIMDIFLQNYYTNSTK
ncbi:MAG: helix-turn-helix domain-containing protein [Fusobacteriaceae bacterium]